MSWEPIGNSTTPFKGTFNGNYKIIDNLYINSENNYQGLFGEISNASIFRIIIGNNSTIIAKERAAAIVGMSSNSEIKDCGNNAKVEVDSDVAGGVICEAQYSKVSNCYNKGEIIANNKIAGGIVAYNGETTIRHCYNIGSIKSNRNLGGIVGEGFDKTEIYNCYNAGKIETLEGDGNVIGGISSRLRNTGVISYCYNIGDIECGSTNQIGGIVGELSAYNGTTHNEEQKSIVKNSYNKGNISTIGTKIGGIVGVNNLFSNVDNCYVLDTVKIEKESTQAEDNIGTSPNCIGMIIGNNASSYTNIGTLTSNQMPTVYDVLNELNTEKSPYWSDSNLEQPKLLWEK